MKQALLFLLFSVNVLAGAAQSAQPISLAGDSLRNFYLSLHVETLWQAGHHISWDTGEADYPEASSGNHTHCSAFIAAACKQLQLYVLRPPEHKQELLANAQFDWLAGAAASAQGWKPVNGENAFAKAQSLANSGHVVLAVCKNPDQHRPGHAALVMPAEASPDKLSADGPFVIQAGTHNYNKIALRKGFASHLIDWPASNILFYYNTRPVQYPL